MRVARELGRVQLTHSKLSAASPSMTVTFASKNRLVPAAGPTSTMPDLLPALPGISTAPFHLLACLLVTLNLHTMRPTDAPSTVRPSITSSS